MAVFQSIIEALERVREALRHTDLEAAGQALAEHDALLRDAVSRRELAVSELEWLLGNQRRLLTDLMAVREGVRVESAGATRSAGAARAYLDTRSRG